MSIAKRTKDERDERRRRRPPSLPASGSGADSERPTVAVDALRWVELVELNQDLMWILEQPDGYLRICPEDDGKNCYWRWKWTKGKWRGLYVMAVEESSSLHGGASLLKRKMLEVYAGSRRPIKDTPWRDESKAWGASEPPIDPT